MHRFSLYMLTSFAFGVAVSYLFFFAVDSRQDDALRSNQQNSFHESSSLTEPRLEDQVTLDFDDKAMSRDRNPDGQATQRDSSIEKPVLEAASCSDQNLERASTTLQERVKQLESIVERFEKRDRVYDDREDDRNLRVALVKELESATDLIDVLDYQFEVFSQPYLAGFSDEDKPKALKIMMKHFGLRSQMNRVTEIYASTYSAQELADLITYYDQSRNGKSIARKEQEISFQLKAIIDELARKNMSAYILELKDNGIAYKKSE